MFNYLLFIYLISLFIKINLKQENSTKWKIRLDKKHNRLDPSGRKARHLTETGTLPLMPVMEMDPGNQAHTQEAGTHQGHIQGSCKVIQTYKTLETEMQAEMKLSPHATPHFHHCLLYFSSLTISHQYDQRIKLILKIIIKV